MAALSPMEKLHNLVATSAIHDGQRNDDDYTGACHPGTREKFLEDLIAWADNLPLDSCVERVSAVAGAGKTAMLRSFCMMLEEKGYSFASFFVWKNDAGRNTLKHFPATIAAQLCRRLSVLVPYIERAIKEDPFLLKSVFQKQMDRLIIAPLLDAGTAVKQERHLIVVIDGLDELDAKGQTELLAFIPSFLSRLSSLPISILVSSRPETQIIGAFQHPNLSSITRPSRLGASDEDIWKFLNAKFDSINLRFPSLAQKNGGKWPSLEHRAIMVKQSSGLFIWPTIAMAYIDKVEKGLRHNERLKQVLSSTEPKPWVASPLDNLYRAILDAHAPADRTSSEFLQFKRCIALLCLPVNLGKFVRRYRVRGRHCGDDWTDTPVRAVFGQTLDEVWDFVADLSALFPSRMPMSFEGELLPTPEISHRSFRDFTFNRERCGDDFYYSSEQDLHAEVACKFIDFFNTQQAYEACIGMSAAFIRRAGHFLKSHLEEATATEELGLCMDNVMLDAIPSSWPLVGQAYVIGNLFDGVFDMAKRPDFPEGERRQKVLLSKLTAFFQSRTAVSQAWDMMLLRLALSDTTEGSAVISYHSVRCWHISCSSGCTCLHMYLHCRPLYLYRRDFVYSTLALHVLRPLVPVYAMEHVDISQEALGVLLFILSLSERNPHTSELSNFVPVYDYWIRILLRYCPPNEDLFNTLRPVCTAPLADLPLRDDDYTDYMVEDFLQQTKAFNTYTERCRAAGIATDSPPVKIPDTWWRDDDIVYRLGQHGYPPPESSSAETIASESEHDLDDTAGQGSGSDEQGDIPDTGEGDPLDALGRLVTVGEELVDQDEPLVALPGIAPSPSLSATASSVSPPIEASVSAHSTTHESDLARPTVVVNSQRRGGFRRLLRKLACW